jgi:hypothetical protein
MLTVVQVEMLQMCRRIETHVGTVSSLKLILGSMEAEVEDSER